MKSIVFGSFLVLAIAACGDDSGTTMPPDGGEGADGGARNCAGNGGADCFDLPEGVLSVGAEMIAPDFSCGAITVMTADHPITISGTIYDFQNDTDEIPNATLDAYYEDITAAPDVSVAADAAGNYSITLPAGRSLMQWRTNRPTTASPQGLPTYGINSPLDVTQTTVTGETRRNVSLTTANALPALIGVERTAGLGVVAGGVSDCSGDDVTHAIGTLAASPSDGNPMNIDFVAGPAVYYFSGNFPVRHNDSTSGRVDTSENGLLVVIEIPPTASGEKVYLQVWGFLNEADMAMGQAGLTLLSEIPSPVIGDSVIASTMEPNKGPF